MTDNILEICNIKYKEAKMKKFPYTAPECFPEIQSDQVKVVIEVFQNLFNELSKENFELKNKINNLERVIKQTRKFNIDDVVQVQTGSQKGAIGKVIEIDNNTVKISYGGTWTGYESHENLKIWIDKNLAE